MDVHISIGHIDSLHVSPAALETGVLEQLANGAPPEVLEDIGHTVPTGTVEAKASEPPLTAEQEEERLQAYAETFSPPDERIRPHTRKAHLLKAMETAGKLRRIRGGITTSQETSIRDMNSAANAHERYAENLGDSLAKACGACAFKGACKLEGRPEAWLRRHPDERRVTRLDQESIQNFRGRLDLEPMAHCIPTRAKKR